MFVVIFDFRVTAARREDYLSLAADLRPHVDALDGFLGIERFQNLAAPDQMVSLSTWRDEAAIAAWRTFSDHRTAQAQGRARIFDDYRLRVGEVVSGDATIRVSEGRGLTGEGDLFSSIVTPDKTLLLGGIPLGGDIERCLGVRIVRDYGMNDRAQAPRQAGPVS